MAAVSGKRIAPSAFMQFGIINYGDPEALSLETPKLIDSSVVMSSCRVSLETNTIDSAKDWIGNSKQQYDDMEAVFWNKMDITCDATKNMSNNVQNYVNADVAKDTESALAAKTAASI